MPDPPADPAPVVIDVEALYRAHGDTAQQRHLPDYERAALAQAGHAADVVLTGRGPVWLYLRLAHALHSVARRLDYRAPEAGDVPIFDHRSR
jgi:hypothetical protein